MKLKYRIEIYMEESNTIEPKKPYFWRLASIDDSSNLNNWCTCSAGWGETYQDAFDQAESFYLEYKKKV